NLIVNIRCTNHPARRRENRSPLHVSSIAQTFVSTTPAARPKSRMRFSSRSVSILAAFFGHATQSIPPPAGINRIALGNSVFNRENFVLKRRITSPSPPDFSRTLTLGGSEPSVDMNPSGAPSSASLVPSLMPRFFGGGGPE